jgi:SH3-like domain-containing protein
MRHLGLKLVLIAALLGAVAAIVATAAHTARTAEEERHLPIPRFVTLRADEVNLRTGPGMRYPVEWVYRRKGYPVEIIARYGHWRQIRDWQGTQGWVDVELVMATRNVIVQGTQHILRASADDTASPVAKLDPGVIAHLLECRGQWCRIETKDITGWLTRRDIWGVFPDEKFP